MANCLNMASDCALLTEDVNKLILCTEAINSNDAISHSQASEESRTLGQNEKAMQASALDLSTKHICSLSFFHAVGTAVIHSFSTTVDSNSRAHAMCHNGHQGVVALPHGRMLQSITI